MLFAKNKTMLDHALASQTILETHMKVVDPNASIVQIALQTERALIANVKTHALELAAKMHIAK